MIFNPPFKFTIGPDALGNTGSGTIVNIKHQWQDNPANKILFAILPGLPSPIITFQGATYDAWVTAGGTEQQAEARLQQMANDGTAQAAFNPVVKPAPAPGSITLPAPTPGAAKAAATAAKS